MTERFSNGCALVIGVANYEQVSPLPAEVLKDASDIAALLKNEKFCGYLDDRVTLLLDGKATGDGIRQGLRDLAAQTRPDDTAVFFFSGHGGRMETGPDQGTYLIPHDCDPKNLKGTAIASGELSALIADIKAKRLVILLDACHSAGASDMKLLSPVEGDKGAIKSGLDKAAYDVLSKGAGRVFMASSRPEEVSYVLPGMPNSLFTHYLLEALRGGAGQTGKTTVGVFDVFTYVSTKVHDHCDRQQPIFKAQDLENNFALALLCGGKGLTVSDLSATRLSSRVQLNGPARVEICQRLGDRWKFLADYLVIPDYDRARFAQGDEARAILTWLEQRRRLGELWDAFQHLKYDDLLEELGPRPQ